MSLRLDPRIPLVWRTPDSVQFGVDHPVARLDGVSALDERLLQALATGAPRGVLRAVVHGDDAAVDRVLTAVGPALLDPARRRRRITVCGTGRVADTVTGLLAAEGDAVTRGRADQPEPPLPEVAVLVEHGVTAPRSAGAWLRRDIAHLPVVITGNAITVGPLVAPGRSPCLHCLALHRADDDAAHVAISAQVLGRRFAEPPLLATEAAVAAVRMLQDGVAGTSLLVTAAGVSRRTWTRHPECACWDATQRGNDSVAASSADASPARPTTAAAAGALA
ncbi:bacteriocin biosynthesis cyclodehydratase domain-containing protein [Diaminobutyricimonas aerilata]|uniref:Bacteriocin biosynthesis cyclodehydratase domain-containing protein n=1 Tax=Diaminobutyricimonas aerilata TaxID=1162967 RepID=A0A2M9CIC6_9MICO|nr:bacteriocin biosynthesis cyclodehydratase domain-containing protein [Diaminobutyricimonas aerilata]